MAGKSVLLEYLIKESGKLKEKINKKSISSNIFMISVLQVLDSFDAQLLPDELKSPDVKDEIQNISHMIHDDYPIVYKEAIEQIYEFICSESYKPRYDELLFGKLAFSAPTKAKNKGLECIDASVYVELMLAEPTEAIKKFVLSAKTNSDPLPDTDEAASEEAPKPEVEDVATNENANDKKQELKHFSGTDSKNEGDKPEEKAEKTDEEPTEKITGSQKLARLVDTTKQIQKKLLENVYGQDHAINTFVSGYFQSQLMAYSRPGYTKPQATFLFAGPPGVGKTFLAESVADALGLPYKRFDMSEYSGPNGISDFIGYDKNYRAAKEGTVTGFVKKNPKCILLFDEIEKAHIDVIHLFLQMLDAGRLRDEYHEKVVSFTDAVIILTTNVGRNLYDDPSIINLSSIPRKKIVKALSTDVDPITKNLLFPAAICSRFASGNIVMFNHLEASNLFKIAKKELMSGARGFEEAIGVKINVDDKIASAIMFSEGGKADARTVKGRATSFFNDELYELLRLLSSEKGSAAVEKLKKINIDVPLEGLDSEITEFFVNSSEPEVLIFANGDTAEECKRKLNGKITCHVVDRIADAKEVLFNHDITVVLCDVSCNPSSIDKGVLNVDDIDSEGRDFLEYVLQKHPHPVYLVQKNNGDINQEEFLSFAALGVREILTVKAPKNEFASEVIAKCTTAYQQSKMHKLAKENKSLSYRTLQTVSKSGTTANIDLYNFRLILVTDTDDSKNILDNVSRPNVHFDEIIGAEDAKQELKYFVEYLKNPVEYMRKGVRSPKGVLLYGPPGTGKTLLAKAMAGESGVTFLKAEGNQFLKRFVGEGPEAIHSLFKSARKYAPSIVFIDEIDAIGKSRDITGDSVSSSDDILTALLTEMDGFNTDTTRPVFVLAATNFGIDPDEGKSLDPALTRRFDRLIYVDLPNKEERKRYLEMKLSKTEAIKLSEEQLENIAVRSTGMSLAELESVFEMALRNAIRSQSGVVGDAEFEDAFETFNGGEEKTWDPSELERTARHEAGHALLCWMYGEKPSYLTIVARGDHGGYMQHANSENKGMYTRKELLNRIRTSLAGRAAEIVYYGSEDGLSTGALGDLYNATNTAKRILCCYGMDESIGLSYRSSDSADYSQAILDKVNSMLKDSLDEAIQVIEKNKKAIDEIVSALMVKNHLKEKEIDEILSNNVSKKAKNKIN